MKKICIAIISIALIIAFGISLNNVEKTELQSTDGRDFEKATVTEIVSSDYSDSTSKDYDGSVGIDGFTAKSICAIVGTIIGVVLAAVFAFIFGKICHISGYNVDDIESLIYIGEMTDIKVGELMFAGILISALGAVMDVAMSVASTINEIHDKNPKLDTKELFKSGINVGKDMMGTMSNTLILAFAGGSINTFVYIYSYNYQYYQVLDMYSIGIEIIQGISATLGVILTVPIVSAISAVALKKNI